MMDTNLHLNFSIIVLLLVPLALGLAIGLLDRRSRPLVLALLAVAGVLLVPLIWYLRSATIVKTPMIDTLFQDSEVSEYEGDVGIDPSRNDVVVPGSAVAIPSAGSAAVTEDVASTKQPSEQPKERPQWIESVPKMSQVDSLSDLTQFRVMAGPHLELGDCQREVKKELQQALDSYIGLWVQDSSDRPRAIFKSDASDFAMVVRKGQFHEEDEITGLGPMQQLHVLFEVKPTIDGHLRNRMKQAVVAERLAQTGIGFGGLLVVLGISFSCLRYNLATQRIHQRRLKFLAFGAILAVIAAAGVLVVRWAPWV